MDDEVISCYDIDGESGTCRILLHPRINERHPNISNQDISDAWNSSIASIPRSDRENEELLVVGMDSHGRLLEMIAQRIGLGSFLIFHALTPPTKKALAELRLIWRKS